MQIHTLELPRLKVSSDNPAEWTSLERWAYFLSFAEEMSLAEVARTLLDPIFLEAAEVLAMISQTPEDRRLYEARQKVLRDEAWRLRTARDEGHTEGHTEGLELGFIIGRIKTLQAILRVPATSRDELAKQDIGVLQSLVEDLQRQFEKQQNE